MSVWLILQRFLVDMEQPEENPEFPSCDAYFQAIQSKKKLPLSLQESLTAAFAQIPVSSFPEVPTGRGTPFCETKLLKSFLCVSSPLLYIL
jgi:hypothetical protein